MRDALRFNSGDFGERNLSQSARFAGFSQPCSDKSWRSNSHRILSKEKIRRVRTGTGSQKRGLQEAAD
jgi:hypothetical protein